MSLDSELASIINEIAYENKRIFDNKKYVYLVSLCAQDISIINLISEKKGISAKQISIILNSPKSTINSAVKRLIENDYLSKKVNEADKREFFLYLTEKGLKAVAEHDDYERKIIFFIKNMWIDQDELRNVLEKRKKQNELQNTR